MSSSESDDYEPVVYNNVVVRTEYPHLQKYLAVLVLAPKFQHWVHEIGRQNEFDLKSFTLTDIDFFGPPVPERLGFYKGKGEVYDKNTGMKIISNIANNRGGCTACLIIATAIINGEKRKLVPLVKQARFASCGEREELVAGMKDAATGQLKGPMITEIQQELPIDIIEEDPRLVQLGKPIWPSPGWSDETIDLWAIEVDIDEEKYNYLLTGTFGEGAHEIIKVKFYDYDEFDDVLDVIGDVKAECAWRRYQRMKKQQQTCDTDQQRKHT